MKKLSETKALQELGRLKADYQILIRENYEPRAADCNVCPTKGACCLDAHFVNVHISRLEAVAIRQALERLPEERQREIYRRAAATVEKYGLKTAGDSFRKTFACPLFEKESGCLVHSTGKPAPCISHACYENHADLPPEDLQTEVETNIERLNSRTYGDRSNWLPLPVWLAAIDPFD